MCPYPTLTPTGGVHVGMRYKFYLLTTICLLALIKGMGQNTDSCNAGFSYSISQANGKAVTFVAADSGRANTLISTWNFGDGTTQHGINVSHTYTAWGTYTVTHRVVDSVTHCMDSSSQTIQLDSASACFPGGISFTYARDSSKAYTYTFTPSPNNNKDHYYWSFGDGTTSTQRTPTHTFGKGDSALYSALVSLTIATTGKDSCSASTSQLLSLGGPIKDSTPTCNLASIVTIIDSTFKNKPGYFYFYAYPQNTTYKYYWNFGDGTTSTKMDPTHQYAVANQSYNVTLFVVAPPTKAGQDSCTGLAQLITTNPGGDSTHTGCTLGTANFSYTSDSAHPYTVHFLPSPDSSKYNYYWNFGDGSTSTVAAPTHSYANVTASYAVSLVITQSGPDSCQGFVQNNVHIQSDSTGHDSTGNRCALAYLSFSYTRDSWANRTIHFLPSPDSNAYHYYWNFGDGSTSTQAAPTHTYAASPSNYTVNLIATASGPDSCQGAAQSTIYFNDSTANRCALGSLSFSYSTDSAAKRTVHFLPSPDSSAYHYYWSFGDGTTSTLAAPTHTFAAGTSGFLVYLVATTSGPDSCQGEAQNMIYFSDSTGSDTTHSGCTLGNAAIISYADTTNPLTIHFLSQSTVLGNNYYWSFGDGSTSTQTTPTHTYAHAGTYQVGVNITINAIPGSTDSCQSYAQEVVTVDSSITPLACSVSFSATFDSSSARTIHFQSYPVPDSVVSAQWNIVSGDSNYVYNLTGLDPTLTVGDTGIYIVTLQTQSASGCTAYAQNQIDVTGSKWMSTPNDTVARIQSYPNPATDFVNLKVNLKKAGPISITIFSAMGSQVGVVQTSGASGDNQVSIPVKNLPQGIYFMHIQSGNTSSQSRFQKQ